MAGYDPIINIAPSPDSPYSGSVKLNAMLSELFTDDTALAGFRTTCPYQVVPAIETGVGTSTTLALTVGDSTWVHGRRLFIPKAITPTKVRVMWSGSVGGSGTRDFWVAIYNKTGTTRLGQAKITLAGVANYNEAVWSYAIVPGEYILAWAFIASGTASITMRVHQLDAVGAVLNAGTTKYFFVSDQHADGTTMPATLGAMTDPLNAQSKSIPWTLFAAE